MQTEIKKQNKYTYLLVIQQFYGQGWEDVNEYEVLASGQPKNINDRQCIYSDTKEYRLMGYPTRLIKRKTLNKEVN